MLPVQPKIIIIGAGVAGIGAATRLLKAGFENVKILEAEDRIGGRVCSVPFGGTIVDLGAQWIHGEEGNVVYQMMKDQQGIIGHCQTADYHSNLNFVTSDKSKLNPNLLERLREISDAILDDQRAALEFEGSLGDYFEEKFSEKVLEEFDSENYQVLKAAEMLQDWTSKFLLCLDPAECWHHVASRSIYSYKTCEGDLLINWKNNGFANLLPILISKANLTTEELLERHVVFNKEVSKITWNARPLKVDCSDGSQFQADYVIVTVSAGVLKQSHRQLFNPQLPDKKINCIEKVAFGSCHKILLKFKEKWWPDDVTNFSFLWSEGDKTNLPIEFPEGPTKDNRSWLEDIFGFYTVDSHPNILLGWLVGPMVAEVEQLSDELVERGSMFLLKKFLGDTYNTIPAPESILRSKWSTNPHFSGTYSYDSPNMENDGRTQEGLAQPVEVDGEIALLFAGEATHSHYYSTVHGALETGYREADRLINIYQRNFRKIIIVGAGMAGLGAALRFAENDLNNFLIIEAQSEAGGRIKTVQVNGKALDLGAQWMHGTSNPLYKIASANRLLADEQSEEGLGLYVRSNGNVIDQYTVGRVAFKIGQILEDCDSSNSGALSDYLQRHFEAYLTEEVRDTNLITVYKELYDWHVRFQVIDNSCRDLSRLSAKSWSDYVCPDDEAHSNFKNGYRSLVDVILRRIPAHRVHYNREVARIEFTNNRHRLKLQFKEGDWMECDHLILTPSLGVLKAFPNLSEVLPAKTIRNIELMGFAGICKIFLFYSKKWWGESNGFQLLWQDDCDLEEKDGWLRQITGFDQVFNHPTALMTWVGGDAVQEVESLSPDNVAVQCTALLRKFLPSYEVPEPCQVFRTEWLSNPHVKGSYCHITPECDDVPESGIQALAEPVFVEGVPRILLAGEAIHTSHYSTTHGAFESGQAQAQVICDYVAKSS